MKIYSDTLTAHDLYSTLPAGMFIDDIDQIGRPQLRRKGWKLQTAGNGPRYKNNGRYGGAGVHAATYDDHGRWFARLYAIDPNALICYYKNAADFHHKTSGKYNGSPH